MEMTTKPFVTTLLKDQVKLGARHLNKNLSTHILRDLQKRFEGKCSHHGYILPHSIKIHSHSVGKINDLSLNGDVEFMVQYHADLCNPAVGSIMKARATKTSSKTNYAHFAEIFVDVNVPNGSDRNKKKAGVKQISIIEIVLLKKISVRFEDVKVGDELHVEIMGKKFQLNDRSISAWGKIVDSSSLRTLLDKVQTKMETDLNEDLDNDVDSNDLDSDDGSETKNDDDDKNNNDEDENGVENGDEAEADEDVDNIGDEVSDVEGSELIDDPYDDE